MSESFKVERKIRIAILTISDTRNSKTDASGALIKKMAEEDGVEVLQYRIVKDDADQIKNVLVDWLRKIDLDAIISTGGTGIAQRDNSIEAIEPFYDKVLPGFGELFRYISFAEDIGSKVLLSRASAGTTSGKAIFILPGSSRAVKLAMERLILPEIRHITFELKKHHQLRK